MIGNIKRTYKGYVEIETNVNDRPITAVFLVAVPDVMFELNRLQKDARIIFETKTVDNMSYLDSFRPIW